MMKKLHSTVPIEDPVPGATGSVAGAASKIPPGYICAPAGIMLGVSLIVLSIAVWRFREARSEFRARWARLTPTDVLLVSEVEFAREKEEAATTAKQREKQRTELRELFGPGERS